MELDRELVIKILKKRIKNIWIAYRVTQKLVYEEKNIDSISSRSYGFARGRRSMHKDSLEDAIRNLRDYLKIDADDTVSMIIALEGV